MSQPKTLLFRLSLRSSSRFNSKESDVQVKFLLVKTNSFTYVPEETNKKLCKSDRFVSVLIFSQCKCKPSYLHSKYPTSFGGGPKRTLLVLSAIFKYFFYAIFLFALSVYAIFYAFSNYTKSDKQ